MKRIYKYPVEMTEAQAIELPKGSEILTVQTQGTTAPGFRPKLMLWALVETGHEKLGVIENIPQETFRIRIFTTGDVVDDIPMRHISTFQISDGMFVGHVFIEINEKG